MSISTTNCRHFEPGPRVSRQRLWSRYYNCYWETTNPTNKVSLVFRADHSQPSVFISPGSSPVIFTSARA